MTKSKDELYKQAHQSFQSEIERLQEKKNFLESIVKRYDSEITEISMRLISGNFDKEFE